MTQLPDDTVSNSQDLSTHTPSLWDRKLPVIVVYFALLGLTMVAAYGLRQAGVPTLNDLGQPLRAAQFISQGELDRALFEPDSFAYTSPPAWPLMIAGVAAVTGQTLEWANIWLGWLAWAAVLGAAAICAQVCGIALRSLRGLVTFAAVAASAGSAAALAEFWHPQDLAGTAGVLLGVAAALRRRWWWAALAFGAAIALRHPMALALLPVLFLVEGRRPRLTLLAGAIGVPLLVSWPFFLADPGNFLAAMRADVTLTIPISPVGRLLLPLEDQTIAWSVGRIAPIAAALIITAVVWRLRLRLTPVAVLGAVGAVFASRLIFEPAPFVYYAAPAAVFAILAGPARGKWPFVGLAGVWVLSFAGGVDLRKLAASDPSDGRLLVATLCWTVGTALLFVALGRWWRSPQVIDAPAGPDTHVASPLLECPPSGGEVTSAG